MIRSTHQSRIMAGMPNGQQQSMVRMIAFVR